MRGRVGGPGRGGGADRRGAAEDYRRDLLRIQSRRDRDFRSAIGVGPGGVFFQRSRAQVVRGEIMMIRSTSPTNPSHGHDSLLPRTRLRGRVGGSGRRIAVPEHRRELALRLWSCRGRAFRLASISTARGAFFPAREGAAGPRVAAVAGRRLAPPDHRRAPSPPAPEPPGRGEDPDHASPPLPPPSRRATATPCDRKMAAGAGGEVLAVGISRASPRRPPPAPEAPGPSLRPFLIPSRGTRETASTRRCRDCVRSLTLEPARV